MILSLTLWHGDSWPHSLLGSSWGQLRYAITIESILRNDVGLHRWPKKYSSACKHLLGPCRVSTSLGNLRLLQPFHHVQIRKIAPMPIHVRFQIRREISCAYGVDSGGIGRNNLFPN